MRNAALVILLVLVAGIAGCRRGALVEDWKTIRDTTSGVRRSARIGTGIGEAIRGLTAGGWRCRDLHQSSSEVSCTKVNGAHASELSIFTDVDRAVVAVALWIPTVASDESCRQFHAFVVDIDKELQEHTGEACTDGDPHGGQVAWCSENDLEVIAKLGSMTGGRDRWLFGFSVDARKSGPERSVCGSAIAR